MTSRRHIIDLFHLLLICAFPFASAASELVQIRRIGDAASLQYGSVSIDGNQLIYSRYDKSGTNQEIVALDTSSGSTDVLVTGRPDARFVTRDSRYLIHTERGRSVSTLVAIDRVTGRSVGRVGLVGRVEWAQIVGDELVAFQSGGDGLVLALPGLKVKSTTPIQKFAGGFGAQGVMPWRDKIVAVVGDTVTIFDRHWIKLETITLPKRNVQAGYSCGAGGKLAVYKDKAVIDFHCGGLLVIDLPAQKIDLQIPGYAMHVSFAVVDGLIVTVNADPSRQPHESRVFDLATGRELANLPLKASYLYASPTALVAIEFRWPNALTIDALAINVTEIRGGQVQLARLRSTCGRAALPAMHTEIYDFIDACESAGIGAFLKDDEFGQARDSVLAYGLALAQTLGRNEEAVEILRRFKRGEPDPSIDAALAFAEWKVGALNSTALPRPSTDAVPSLARNVMGWGSPTPMSKEVPINFGAFDSQMYFIGDQLIIGRHGASDGTGAVSLALYRRSDLQFVNSVGILGDDSTYQDGIASIAADARSIYLAIDYRYSEDGQREKRTNLVVVNRSNLEVTARRFVHGDLGWLLHDGKQLLSCGCGSNDDRTCRVLEPMHGRLDAVVSARCIGQTSDTATLVTDISVEVPPSGTWLTANYSVKKIHTPASSSGFEAAIRSRGANQEQKTVRFSRTLTVEALEQRDSLLLMHERNAAVRLTILELSGDKRLTLAEFPIRRNARPIVSTDARFAYVGLGRDLLAFDLNSGQLLAYLRDFIQGGFQDNGNGIDRGTIHRMIQDRGRLIVLTFDGSRSRVLEKSALTNPLVRGATR
jgi:hypothetical protein